ncbi:MAG TPA: hypothetical protein PKV94_07730 [Syntrophales bacterium]|jgi:hypothetical protein|nr:hypothetical protein [Syntrophales bacterium]HPN24879.1 hypothetical protein [Syntrophales bacterium]
MIILDPVTWCRRKLYKVKHRERIREMDKAYYEKHREEILERRKARRAALRKKRLDKEMEVGRDGKEKS